MIDQASADVSCKWLLTGMATAIAVMGGAILGMAAYIKHLVNRVSEVQAEKDKVQAEKDKIYDERISDLKDNHSLVDTLMNVVTKKRKGEI